METQQPTLQAGQIIDERYRVIELIGRGASGEVYRCQSLKLEHEVALKLIKADLFVPVILERAKQEARTLASLDHPNIVKIYGFGSHKNSLYLAMALAQGRTLAQIIKAERKLSPRIALPMLMELCDAMTYLHEHEIIHRDLKPSNVMLSDTGAPVLIDFGLAKGVPSNAQQLTKPGEFTGTPHYMSPEVCSGSPASKQSDIYSFGCLMYECLTGETVFTGENPIEIMIKHLRATLPMMPAFCEKVLRKCLDKDLSRRYASFKELKDEMLSLTPSDGLNVVSKKQPPRSLYAQLRSFIWTPSGAIVILSLLICTGSLWSIYQGWQGHSLKSLSLKDALDMYTVGGDNLRAMSQTEPEVIASWRKEHTDAFSEYQADWALYNYQRKRLLSRNVSPEAERALLPEFARLKRKFIEAGLALNQWEDMYPYVYEESLAGSRSGSLNAARIGDLKRGFSIYTSHLTDAKLSTALNVALLLSSIEWRNKHLDESAEWANKVVELSKKARPSVALPARLQAQYQMTLAKRANPEEMHTELRKSFAAAAKCWERTDDPESARAMFVYTFNMCDFIRKLDESDPRSRRRYQQEWGILLERAIEAADRFGCLSEKLALLNHKAIMLQFSGDKPAALALFESNLQFGESEKSIPRKDVMFTRYHLSNMYHITKQIDKAITLNEEILKHPEHTDLPFRATTAEKLAVLLEERDSQRSLDMAQTARKWAAQNYESCKHNGLPATITDAVTGLAATDFTLGRILIEQHRRYNEGLTFIAEGRKLCRMPYVEFLPRVIQQIDDVERRARRLGAAETSKKTGSRESLNSKPADTAVQP